MDEEKKCFEECGNDYFIVKAIDGPAQIIGMTRGPQTKPHHTENLDPGEILLLQFTDKTSAVKIRGKVEVYTKFGMIKSGDK